MMKSATSIKFSFLGHSGRVFDIRRSSDSQTILSSSEDGTARLWSVSNRRCLFNFQHDLSSEVLRATFIDKENKLVCTCGSDGNAKLWQKQENSSNSNSLLYRVTYTIPHGDTQIYACESVNNNSVIITGAENSLFFWDVETNQEKFSPYHFQSIHSILGGTLTNKDQTVFGGVRNPDMIAYVFDVKEAPVNSSAHYLCSVAMSDGTVRLVDTRSPITDNMIPITHPVRPTEVVNTHVTSTCWDENANDIIISLASGGTAVLDLRQKSIRAYLEAPEARGVFGGVFRSSSSSSFSSSSSLSSDGTTGRLEWISWAGDGLIRVWDITTVTDLCTVPLRTYSIPGYSVLCAVQLSSESCCSDILCGGGTPKKSFIGQPLHVIDIAA